MAKKKNGNEWLRLLRQPMVLSVLVLSVAFATAMAIPGVRHDLGTKLDAGANLFLFDGDVDGEGDSADAAPDSADPNGKKPNRIKRIVGAPVRLFARLFKGGKGDDVARKSTEKDAERMKIVPINRTINGVPGEMADTNGTTREASTAEAAAQNLFEEAVTLHDKGRLDGAIEKLIAATVLQSNFAEAFNLLAVCYDEKGNYKSAQDEYKKALKLDSSNARFLNNIGYSYYLSGDNGNAVKWYNKGLKVTPNDRRMHNNIGLAYGRKGDYDKARDHFKIAVGETGANLNLGYVYSQQGKFDLAIKHYEAALQSQPSSLPALSNLSQLYERTGRLREAAVLNEQYKKLNTAARQKDQTAGQDQDQ